MPPAEPPNDITVRVKVPPGHVPGSSADEFTLGVVPASSRIGDLRQQIQQLLPSHPSPDRQRLLYLGRALVDNEQTLAAAFNTKRDTTQNEYVLHLLVRGDQDAAGVQAVPGRVSAGLTRGGAGLLSSIPPHEQGGNARATPQSGDAAPQGLPQLPQPVPQPPYNLQHAQHLALLQQRQAQQQINQHMQQLGRQRPGVMGIPQMQAGRPLVGMPQANFQHPLQYVPVQGPQHQGLPTGGGQDQTNPQGTGEDAPANTARSEGATDADTQAAQSSGTEGQQPQAPHRPVSDQGFHVQGVGPDGNRFEIHQQTLNIPFPGQQQGQFGLPMPGMGLPFPLPGMAQQQRQPNPSQQANGPSALDRARQNVAEMRQMVDSMRNDNATEEDRARTARLQEHIQAVNDYIDPFGVGRPTARSRSASPFPARMAQSMRASPSLGLGPFVPPPRQQPSSIIPSLPSLSQHARQPPQPTSTSDATCYLLSSPQGPQALLFSPQHGTYTGSFAPHAATGISIGAGHTAGLHRVARAGRATGAPTQPTPTGNAGPANGEHAQGAGAPADPADAALLQAVRQINQANQQAQARPQAQENPLGPMQPILGHFWLLLRVMIFAYFILGTNMGWRRPLALAFIGLGFWMLRAGLFGEGGVARRWWDGIVRVDQRPRQQAQGQGAAAADGEQRPGQLPTPEELAQRLIEERQQALNQAPMHRIREHLRPVERAAALFFASFWPGVGEAHVRAREAEERRLMEEEVERRRRMEEEAQRAIEAEQEGEKKDVAEEEKSIESAVVDESGEQAAVEKDASAVLDGDSKGVEAATGAASGETAVSTAAEQPEQ